MPPLSHGSFRRWKPLLALACCLLLPAAAPAQQSPADARENDYFDMLYDLAAGQNASTFDTRKRGGLEGELHWDERFLPCYLLLRNGLCLGPYPARYLLPTKEIEVETPRGSQYLAGGMICSARFVCHADSLLLLNPDTYWGGSANGHELYELLEEGRISLLRRCELDILKPDYLPTHDTGSLTSRAIRKFSFYLHEGGRLLPIPRKKEEVQALFRSLAPGIEGWMAGQKLNYRDAEGLQALVRRCNGG
jgi:hypothetical protein